MRVFFLILLLVFTLSAANTNAENDQIFEKAKSGDPEAQYQLGMRYALQKPSDEKSAFEWFLKSAEGGLVGGMDIVGQRYAAGMGTKPDEIRAYAWYSFVPERFEEYDKLAEKFSEEQRAQANKLTEQLQASVHNIEKKNPTAGKDAFCLKWYLAAAEAQFAQCPFSRRPKMDLEKAYFWGGLAIRNGKQSDGLFRKIGILLTQEKRLKLNAMMRDWKPKRNVNVEQSPKEEQTVTILPTDRYPSAPDFLEEERNTLADADRGDVNAQSKLGRLYSVESDGGLSLHESREYLHRQITKLDEYLERNADTKAKQNLKDGIDKLKIPVYGCSSATLTHTLVGLDISRFEKLIDEVVSMDIPVTSGECL